MAYINPVALSTGLEYLRDNCTHIHLLANLQPGDEDDWVTFYGKTIGNTVISSNDFSAITVTDGDASIIFIGKQGTATATSSGHTLSIAIVDEFNADPTKRVLSVTAETTARAVVSGETFSFPSYTTYVTQPTQL